MELVIDRIVGDSETCLVDVFIPGDRFTSLQPAMQRYLEVIERDPVERPTRS